MTLVEIIISLAILSMLAACLVLIGTTIEKYSRAARHLNDKVTVQAPVAEAQDKNSSVKIQDTTLVVNGNITVNGELYNAAEFEYDADGNYVQKSDDSGTEGLNIKYVAGIDNAAPNPSP